MNTISFYNRILRAVYNRAVEKGFTKQVFPFKHVYTGVEKTIKRGLPINTIRNIRNMDLSHCRTLDYARDMFLFSFYTRGMSFVDMAYLKKNDLKNGVLIYRVRKPDNNFAYDGNGTCKIYLKNIPCPKNRPICSLLF